MAVSPFQLINSTWGCKIPFRLWVNLSPAFGLMIVVAQAFLAVWFWSTVFLVFFPHYNNGRKNFKNYSHSNFVNNLGAKPSLMKFTVKYTLVNGLYFVKTSLKVTEKNTFCM